MKSLWAIQKYLVNDLDSEGFLDSIVQSGRSYVFVDVKPFDYDNIPDITHDGPIIPYGGTKFIDKLRHTKNWKCWFNDNFRYKIYLEKFGKYMFNSDGVPMCMRDFCPSNYPGIDYLFIRPDKDLKEFAGNNIKPEDFIIWYRKLQDKKNGFDIGEDTEIIVAKSSRIDREWRVFVVNGEPISGSRYRNDHYMSINKDVPAEVYEFVCSMVRIWVPSQVFVMDICELNGELYILELGDFHSAGWYDTDKKRVIEAVSEFAESRN